MLQLSSLGSELLDDREADPAAVALSLANIARANRLLGGQAAIRRGLERIIPAAYRGALTLLDVGTGAGDVPVMTSTWLAQRGVRMRAFGVEPHPAAARVARATGLATVRACGGRLPFADAAVDVVVVSQVAHHLARDACITLFRECHRVARLGVVVADLRRSRAAAVAFRLVAPLLGFDRHTTRDGVLSLRRGFTIRELQRLTQGAGVTATTRRSYGARLVASWRADG